MEESSSPARRPMSLPTRKNRASYFCCNLLARNRFLDCSLRIRRLADRAGGPRSTAVASPQTLQCKRPGRSNRPDLEFDSSFAPRDLPAGYQRLAAILHAASFTVATSLFGVVAAEVGPTPKLTLKDAHSPFARERTAWMVYVTREDAGSVSSVNFFWPVLPR